MLKLARLARLEVPEEEARSDEEPPGFRRVEVEALIRILEQPLHARLEVLVEGVQDELEVLDSELVLVEDREGLVLEDSEEGGIRPADQRGELEAEPGAVPDGCDRLERQEVLAEEGLGLL